MTELRITDVKTYIIPPSFAKDSSKWCDNKTFLFVKLETNKGIQGWGESYVLRDRERCIEMYIKELKRYLMDFDPSMIKYFQNWAYNAFAEGRPGIDLFCAISGIEIAMWDIMGKYFQTPVYNLLGGAVHEKLRLYANLSSHDYKSPEDVARHAKEMVDSGFSAVKMYPFDFGEDDEAIVERVAKVREAIGDKTDLMVDIWKQAEPERAVRIAKRIESLNIIWYEEPIPSDNLEVLAEIRSKISLPIVAGESIWGKRAYSNMFKMKAVDIINADISVVGGVLELKEIAAMAEANYIQIGPHNCNSTTVSTSATVHAACTMPNFNLLEVFPSYWEIGDKICKNQLRMKDGYYYLPEDPGLGLEMNEDYLASVEYKARPRQSKVYCQGNTAQ